jgi:hypothetical protein
MTRQGPRKAVGPDYWRGRRDSARDHLERARDAITLAKPTQDARAIVSLIVLADIAYADALTANRAMVVHGTCRICRNSMLRCAVPLVAANSI